MFNALHALFFMAVTPQSCSCESGTQCTRCQAQNKKKRSSFLSVSKQPMQKCHMIADASSDTSSVMERFKCVLCCARLLSAAEGWEPLLQRSFTEPFRQGKRNMLTALSSEAYRKALSAFFGVFSYHRKTEKAHCSCCPLTVLNLVGATS